MNKNLKFLTLILTSAIASASQKNPSSASEKQQAEQQQVPAEYNVPGGLGGLGKDIYLHILNEMNSPETHKETVDNKTKKATDIQALLTTSRTMANSRQDKYFPWATSPAAIQAASDFINNPDNQTEKGKEECGKYIKEHLDPSALNVQDAQGRTALHLAAQYGLSYPDPKSDPESESESKSKSWLAEYLISYGANPFIFDAEGNTPLTLAIDSEYKGIRELLWKTLIEQVRSGEISAKFINLQDRKGFTLLHYAIQFGDLSAVETLIEHGADILALNGENYTPLTLAFHHNRIEMLGYFLKQSPNQITSDNVNQEDCMGWTPLHYVSMMQRRLKQQLATLNEQLAEIQREAIELRDSTKKEAKKAEIKKVEDEIKSFGTIETTLLENGANQEARDILGLNPYAPYAPNPNEVIGGLIGGLPSVMCHVAHGADVNKADRYGENPLHIASMHGHLSVVEMLINHGADVNKADSYGKTALHIASSNGHQSIVEYLVNHGADVNQGDNYGWDPLHIASEKGHLSIVELLINHGADVNRTDLRGWTPLCTGASEGHLSIVEYLVNHGADVNKGSNYGKTPLNVASENGHLSVVEYLIDSGADVNKADKYGEKTPLHIASQNGHLFIVELLLQHGADVNKADNDGYTPLHYAAMNGDLPMVKYLVSHGADVNKTDLNGHTPLDSAALAGHEDVKNYLQQRGNIWQRMKKSSQALKSFWHK